MPRCLKGARGYAVARKATRRSRNANTQCRQSGETVKRQVCDRGQSILSQVPNHPPREAFGARTQLEPVCKQGATHTGVGTYRNCKAGRFANAPSSTPVSTLRLSSLPPFRQDEIGNVSMHREAAHGDRLAMGAVAIRQGGVDP